MKKRLHRRRKTRKRSSFHSETISSSKIQQDSVAPSEDFDLSNPEIVLQLQQLHGNQFVSRMIQRTKPDDAGEAYTQTQVNADHYALWEAIQMFKAIDRDAELSMDYYRSKTIPNYIGRKIWYAAQKDVSASQRLHHLQNAHQQFQPIIKRYSQRSNFLPSQFRIQATKCRIKLEKKMADEKIIKREEELKDSSFGLGTLSEDKMRLELIASVKKSQSTFEKVMDVGEKARSKTQGALGVAQELAPDVVDRYTPEALTKAHLAGEDVSKEMKEMMQVHDGGNLDVETGEKKDPSLKSKGEKTAENLGDVILVLKGIGYAMEFTDVVTREKALQEALDKYPQPVAKAANMAGKTAEILQYGLDVSSAIVRRVAQYKGGDALKQVTSSLEAWAKVSKNLGAIGSGLMLIRDLTVLVDDDSSAKDKEAATLSAVSNTTSLAFFAAGAKGASYASPVGWALFLTQVMLEQTGEHVFWKSNQALISGFSKKIFTLIHHGIDNVSPAASKLKATNEVMLSGQNKDSEGVDPWKEDVIDSHITEDNVRNRLKYLDLRMRDFIDIVLNPKSERIPQVLGMYRPGGYGVIREYFEGFDYLQQSVDFDSMSGEELQDYVDNHLESASDLIKTYRMFRMQEGDIAQVLGTRYEGDRDALTQDIMKNKDKLAEVFA